MKDELFQADPSPTEFKYSYAQQNPEYMGEPINPEHTKGPTQDRRCRDVLCCIIFAVFWAGMIIMAIFAFTYGHPDLLGSPFDSAGFQCGVSLGYENFRYGYYQNNNIHKFACINECPSSNSSTPTCIFNNVINNCSNFGIYPTYKYVNFCYPTFTFTGGVIYLGIGFFQQSINDLKTTWPILLSVLAIAFILSLIVLLLIHACGGCIVIGLIILKYIALVTLGIVAFEAANNNINININDPTLLYGIAYVCWGLAIIFFLFFICKFRQFKIAINIVKTAALFTKQEPQAITVPIIMSLFIALFFAFWITVSIFLMSSGTPTQCNTSPFACINWNENIQNGLILYFFGLFWTSEVAICLSQFVIASATVYWYFSHLQGRKQKGFICKSFCRALTFHLGSIIFGALILCVMVVVRVIMSIIHKCGKQKSMEPKGAGKCTDCCIGCLECCFGCFQRFIRFISKNAFYIAAITGEGFCASAEMCFYLIKRCIHYEISHGLGHLVMFFGKVVVTVLSTFCGYMMITNIPTFSESIFTPFMPTLMFVVISFVVSSLFMDVFGISSDTLLVAYCLELDVHRGVSKACPEQLKSVLQFGKI